MTQLVQTISRVKKYINPDIKIDGILLTLVDSRTNLAKSTVEALRENFGNHIKMYRTSIPIGVKAAEASGAGKTRFYCKPNLMQCNTSFVILDPKGEILRDTGKLLERKGFEVRVLDLISMEKSHCYNPSGGGKSFAAKGEIENIILSSDADVIIIDPEREYSHLVNALGGEIINICNAGISE